MSLAATTLPAPDPAPLANELLADLPGRIRKVWGMRWNNRWKEIWWRLLLHGIPGAGGHGIPWGRGSTCACGWNTSAVACSSIRALQQREHVCWSCPRAQTTIQILSENLQGSVRVLPIHVWLLIPPCPTLNSQVWWVACLCALNAMIRLRGAGEHNLKEQCINIFLAGLQDFVACQGQQSPLANYLSADHPFIARDNSETLVVKLC